LQFKRQTPQPHPQVEEFAGYTREEFSDWSLDQVVLQGDGHRFRAAGGS